jgi:phospholipid-binding lipoprotein MlaA
MPDYRARLSVFVLAAVICLQIGACGTMPRTADGSRLPPTPGDPWEPLNRPIFLFNGGFDRVTFKPVAKGYQKIVPKFLRLGVTNFSKNLRAPLNIINHFLQGKPREGFRQTGRFVMNSTFGIGGLMDVATGEGLDQKNEDFGQTLAVWGVPNGPFVIVPFLGPRTLRDALMDPLNILADPLLHYNDSSVRDKIYLVRAIDLRARLLLAAKTAEDSYDPYVRVREAFLQRRQGQIDDIDGSDPTDVPADDADEFHDLPEPEEDY